MKLPQIVALGAVALAGFGGHAATGTCGRAHLHAWFLDGWSEATGQHTLTVVIGNRGPGACALDGYPAVTFLDPHGRTLPFMIGHHGDQMLTGRPPRRVRVSAGRDAFFAANKYRCDRGDLVATRTIAFTLPRVRGRFAVRVPPGFSFGYCGPGDPGTLVAVTPIEPTFGALGGH